MNASSLSENGKERYKQVICEELWLKYCNDTLRRHKVITEKEYLKMNNSILIRTGRLLKEIQ